MPKANPTELELTQQLDELKRGTELLLKAAAQPELANALVQFHKDPKAMRGDAKSYLRQQGVNLPVGVEAATGGICVSLCASWNGSKHCLRYVLGEGWDWMDCP